MQVNGWTLYLDPLFREQLERLTSRVEALRAKDSLGYKELPAAKLLATIDRFMREIVPRDPGAAEFRQGNTLGPDNRHWFRAKFHARYRLFYRFSSKQKVIVYAWVNDESTLRKAGAATDPYAVFRAMLRAGNPPDTMAELLAAARRLGAAEKDQARRKPEKGAEPWRERMAYIFRNA
ncbi:MAG: type II toxin-antitoxin system YhaV family toxin [Bryobacteraceae bacterium]|jgi:toxin YhaV